MEPQSQIPQPLQPTTAPQLSPYANAPQPIAELQPQPAQVVAPQFAASIPTPTAPVPVQQQPTIMPSAPAAPSKENIYTEICTQIIKEQSRIIGASLAIEQAASVEGLTIDATTLHCDIIGNGSIVINDLIEKYRDFFGHAAVEVCREAAARFLANLPAEETPSLLKS